MLAEGRLAPWKGRVLVGRFFLIAWFSFIFFGFSAGEVAVTNGVPSASKAEQNGYEDGQCRNSADIRDGDTKINEKGDHLSPI